MSEWATVTVREVAEVFDGPHATPSKTDDGPWYLSISSLNGGRFDLSRSAHLSEADLPRWTKRVAPRPGDTLFSYETRLGEAAYWEYDFPAALGRRMGLLRPKLGIVEPRYLMYAYLGPQFQEVIRQKTLSGATVERIPVGEMPAWPVLLPSLGTQRTILDIVGSVDDLIENNRRRVKVLEEMARAIYREWFVKFRYPGHEDVPMVDSALGPIPEGWGAGKIGELCSRVQAGATPRRSTPEYWDDPAVDWYKTGDLTDGILLGSSEKLSDAGLAAGRTFEPETILMAIYGSPTVGRLGLLTSRASANQAALGLVADPDLCTTEYLWFVLESLRGYLNQIAQGAAQQNVSKEKVIGCDVLMPPREVLKNFTLRAAPGWRLSHELARQAAVLESLRDLLLPKLMTGQIDVSAVRLDDLLREQVA